MADRFPGSSGDSRNVGHVAADDAVSQPGFVGAVDRRTGRGRHSAGGFAWRTARLVFVEIEAIGEYHHVVAEFAQAFRQFRVGQSFEDLDGQASGKSLRRGLQIIIVAAVGRARPDDDQQSADLRVPAQRLIDGAVVIEGDPRADNISRQRSAAGPGPIYGEMHDGGLREKRGAAVNHEIQRLFPDGNDHSRPLFAVLFPDEGSEAVEIFLSGETGYVEELVEDDDRLGSGALDCGAEPLVNGDVDRQETAEGIDHQDVLRLRGSRWRTERQEQGEVGRGDAQRTGSPRKKSGCGWCWRSHGAVGGTHVAELQCRNRRVCMQIRKASSHRRSGSDDGQEASRRQRLVLPACSARPGRTRHAIRRDRRA